MDFSTSLQLGKFWENSSVSIPFYYQYSQTVRRPQYDALDLDLLLKDSWNEPQTSMIMIV
jgi:cell surface protein SprA